MHANFSPMEIPTAERTENFTAYDYVKVYNLFIQALEHYYTTKIKVWMENAASKKKKNTNRIEQHFRCWLDVC